MNKNQTSIVQNLFPKKKEIKAKHYLIIFSFILISMLINETLEMNLGPPPREKLVESKINQNYFEDERGILILNDDNYDSFIKEFNTTLLFSYESPCKLCRQIYPELEKTINSLRKLSPPVYLAKLNTTENPLITKRLNLHGLFSLKYISDGMPMEYTGGRSGEEIVSWVRAKFDPIIGEIKSVNEIDQLRKYTETLIIFFGRDDNVKYQELFSAARGKENTIFARCNSKQCFDKYDVTEGDIVVIKRLVNEDSKKNKNQYIHTKPEVLRQKDYNKENLSKLLEDLIRQKVMNFNYKVANYIFSEEHPGVFLYRSKSESILYDPIMHSEEIYENAEKNNLKIVITDIVETFEVKLSHILGFNSTDLPRIVIHDTRFPSSLKSYVMDKDKKITKENIIEFMGDFSSKKLHQYYKSQPRPLVQNQNSLTLVGLTLSEYALDPEKDVLVMFYAPWCKNSGILYPIYEKLAEKLNKKSNFLIAKFDAYGNDASIINIEYYPTIALWPSQPKEKPIIFSGDYTSEDKIMEFLRINAYYKTNFSEESHDDYDEIKRLEKEYEETQRTKNASEF